MLCRGGTHGGGAAEFAAKYGFRKAYNSYEELARDPEVDLVYIATPHACHYEHVKLCLNHGKHVLCEKSFTINEDQAKEILTLARKNKLLLTEAMWIRYMPMRKTLDAVLDSGVIGRPYMLAANLGYASTRKERVVKPELGGGALLDVGIYTLNFASMVFGNQVKEVTGRAAMLETGVDAQNSITITYQDGKMAVLNSSILCLSDRRGVIYGDDGYIEIKNINNYEKIKVYNRSRKLIQAYDAPEKISGYEYEVEACVRAVGNGELECREMPHEETLRMMSWMDELRRQWGMVYPMEKENEGVELWI